MISTLLLVIILTVHFIADFVLQSHYVAVNKSKKISVLTYHVLVYSLILFIIFGWQYAVINGIAHWCTDFVTSKLTARLWKDGLVHEFFVVIGFDQLIHTVTLLLTFIWCTENDLIVLWWL